MLMIMRDIPMSDLPGEYPEPDFEDLARVMRDAFKNYTDL
jgi:hypothetical protein